MLIGNSFDSGAIERFAYDPVQRVLVIFFKSGGVYEYRNVSHATFRSFWGAGSKGQFFHRYSQPVRIASAFTERSRGHQARV
jgi:hypothetical protein